MLNELVKYDLDYRKTYPYVNEILKRGITLSSLFLKLKNFKAGHFFSLLTAQADKEKIYEFPYGGLYPVGPLKEVVDKERIYEWYTDGMKDEFVNYLYNYIRNNNISCLFEVILFSRNSPCVQKIFEHCGLAYHQELYYLITPKNASHNLIRECLWRSNAHDHSLCVLTEANFDDIHDKELTLSKLESICLETKLMVFGAYDGEGYVFWENKS